MLLARDSDTCPASKVPSVVPLWSTTRNSRCDATDTESAIAAADDEDDDDDDDNDDDDDDDDYDDILICSLRVDGDQSSALVFSEFSVCRDTFYALLSANA